MIRLSALAVAAMLATSASFLAMPSASPAQGWRESIGLMGWVVDKPESSEWHKTLSEWAVSIKAEAVFPPKSHVSSRL